MDNAVNQEGEDVGGSSGESTPEPPTPFIPEYYVKFTDQVTKDGELVKFTLKVFQNSVIVKVIERIYEDFEYLEHCVITDQPSLGLIVPPLPLPIAIDAQSAETLSKKQMGTESNTLLGDNFKKECQQLEKYVQLLLCHPVLGKSPRLKDFLLRERAPPRTKLRPGLMSKFSNPLEARKAAYPDCEDFFQKERDWLVKYSPSLTKLCNDFNKTIYSQMRIVHQLESIAVVLRVRCVNNDATTNKHFSAFTMIFVDCLESITLQHEEKCSRESSGLSNVLSLWRRYAEAESAMLLRRTHLMVDYQSCNRALEKTKPNRKEEAEKMKLEAEILFGTCSDVAKEEIKRFHMLRSSEILKSIDQYRLQQIGYARNTLSALKSSLTRIKSIQL